MARAERLYRLQGIDLALERVRVSLDEVVARLADDSEVTEARSTLHATRQNLLQTQSRQRALEAEADDLRSKQRELEKKLYGGTVRNTKELSGMQREVEHLAAACSKIEDSALELLGEAEALEEQERAVARVLALCEETRAATVKELEMQRVVLEQELADLEAKRAGIAAEISPQDLERYEHIRAVRQGRAVATLERGMCLGCRLNLSMQEQQKARVSQDLVTCPNCSRILYVEH